VSAKRWPPLLSAVVFGVLAAVAVLGIAFAIGAATDRYEELGNAAGKVLFPVAAGAGIAAYIVQQSRIRGTTGARRDR
jgi:hypothetical protein